MSKKTFCQTIRVATMAVSLFVLCQVYEIGALGYFLVGLTGLVWSITAYIEHDE